MAWVRVLIVVAVALLAVPSWAGEAIVVLGTRVEADGSPSPALRERLAVARDMAKVRPKATIIVTGGAVANGIAEGPAMAKWLRNNGIAGSRIVVESKARHTGENADFVVAVLKAKGIDRITVVTSAFHVPRSLFHFRAALKEQGMKGKVAVAAHGARDGLSGLARLRKNMRERRAIVRDARKRMVRRVRKATRLRHRGKSARR